MIIKIVRRGETVVIRDASLLLVEDDKGDPVSIAAAHGPGAGFTVSCIDNEEVFNRVLRNLGINKTVVKVPMKIPALPPAGK